MARNNYGRVIFNTGDLICIPKDPLVDPSRGPDKLFVVIRRFYSESSFTERLEVIGPRGEVSHYPLAWFEELDEDV